MKRDDLVGVGRQLLLMAVVCTAFSIGGVSWQGGAMMLAEAAQADKPAQGQPDPQRLEGRWVRPDGGYILELAEIKKDGSLMASYFNPRPINVSKAGWSRNEGKIYLAVELRDVNYPGSRYNLQYDPKSDRLKGTYFQAVEKQTFNIEFVRAK